MKLLLDECVPKRLKKDFLGHEILTINEAGFQGLENGELLKKASKTFDVLITVDKNIEHQQNLSNIPMGIVVLSAVNNRYRSLSQLIPSTLKILENIKIGEVIKVK